MGCGAPFGGEPAESLRVKDRRWISCRTRGKVVGGCRLGVCMGETVKILVVDDEKPICDVVKAYLEREGYAVVCAYDGEAALEAFRRESPDLVVLDRMLPKLSGEAVCVHIRAESGIPILMLTARAGEDDLVAGLALGADDYVEKPFRAKELVARAAALLRRAANGGVSIRELLQTPFASGPGATGIPGNSDAIPRTDQQVSGKDGNLIRVGTFLVVDTDSYEVTCKGQPAVLTGKEFKILTVLARHPRKTFTREELIAMAFPDGYDGFDRAIDTYVKNIRKKLTEAGRHASPALPENQEYIRTVHGVGYRMGDLP